MSSREINPSLIRMIENYIERVGFQPHSDIIDWINSIADHQNLDRTVNDPLNTPQTQQPQRPPMSFTATSDLSWHTHSRQPSYAHTTHSHYTSDITDFPESTYNGHSTSISSDFPQEGPRNHANSSNILKDNNQTEDTTEKEPEPKIVIVNDPSGSRDI